MVIALFVPRVVVVAPVEGDVALACLVVKGMGSLIQWGGFVPALSEPMTRDCEGSKVGAIPIEEGMMRNGAAPDVGSPLSPGACEVRSPRPPNGHLWAPRVDQVAYLSGTERQGCPWGACRDSESRAAAQPPGACTRTQQVAWRRCCRVQIAAPRCPRRSPARLGHRSRRPNKQQRKTGSFTALPVASSWPPHRRRQLRSHLSRHRARPCCRHIKNNTILNQPGAWSAEPSGLLSGPRARGSSSPRILPPVIGRVRRSHGGARGVAPSAPEASSW